MRYESEGSGYHNTQHTVVVIKMPIKKRIENKPSKRGEIENRALFKSFQDLIRTE